MRHNHIIALDYNSLAIYNIHDAVRTFYDKHKAVPDTVKLQYQDYFDILAQVTPNGIIPLEKGKQYGHFINIPGGVAEILLLSEDDESFMSTSQSSMNSGPIQTRTAVIVVESSHVDREFEKIVLDKEES